MSSLFGFGDGLVFQLQQVILLGLLPTLLATPLLAPVLSGD